MNRARWRLVVLGVLVGIAGVLFATTGLVDGSAIRSGVAATGAWAPLVYLLVSAVLGAALVPGPLLAGLAGVLFGPVTGTLVTAGSAVLSALLSRAGGRGAGRAGVRDLLGARTPAVERFSRRHGTVAVLAQRLAPGIPDAPLSYAFGAFGLSVRQVAVGTLLGTLPRSFAYSAAGATLGDPASPLGIAAASSWLLSALVGAEIARRGFGAVRRSRRAGPAGAGPRLDTGSASGDGGVVDNQDPAAVLAFVRANSRAVLVTTRGDGGVQSSPVAVGVDADGHLVVSTPSRTAKAHNLTDRPTASLCVVTDQWFGPWLHVDVTAEVVRQPAALPLLEDCYRSVGGEHPDWAEYRAAMVAEDRVLLRLTPTRAAGPGADGARPGGR